jgi:hypothetical protein
MAWLRSPRTAVALAALAFLAFFARALVDWRFVFPDFIAETDVAVTAAAMAFYLAVGAIWIWGIVGMAAGRRSGANAVLILALLGLVVGGVATPVAFCAFPCQTAWPLMEITNWTGIVVGVLASASAFLSRPPA